MLYELYLLQTYFEMPNGAVYEEELVSRFGENEVRGAIRAGLVEHRLVPCGSGMFRGLCWLSRRGCDRVASAIEAGDYLGKTPAPLPLAPAGQFLAADSACAPPPGCRQPAAS